LELEKALIEKGRMSAQERMKNYYED